MYANTQATAMNMGMPDVCKTLVVLVVVPIPYPNIAPTSTAVPNVNNHTIMAMPAHNLMTEIPLSNGNQAGVLGGVVSSMIMGKVKHDMGSTKVFISGAPATMMLSPTGHNGMPPNAQGMTMTPCQTKVMYMS
ncbi:DUF4150 domain-containing protein [Marinomonas transparens]|uniref:DUF4150 domain-containing protein n=1 Tax=Marinomonas transparens TaxID=2795388 RepID=A0A934MY36_9GAMM|nr:DUF4150 domain-containing protein [Marinomonas transparens]MBJ7539994.1 DUF4150 domain-containing protein [Marinomonas transparens]